MSQSKGARKRGSKSSVTSQQKVNLATPGWLTQQVHLLAHPRYTSIIVIFISIITRMYYIHEPDHVCWDETHFGKMASWYLNRTFFFDVHPPLGKMLIALSGHLTGYNGTFTFDKPGDKYEHWTQYLGMRIFCATLGLSIPVMIYRATLSMTDSHLSALLAGLLVVFDNGMITLTRYILLDPPLLFFISASILGLAEFSFRHRIGSENHRPFSISWWFWLMWTGVSICCAFSIKFVGLFTVALIGVRTIYDIWLVLGDTSKPFIHCVMHFVARALCLIVIPIVLYVAFFWIHLNQLDHTGNGDGFYSSAFQSQLKGNSLHNSSSPAHLAYGAEVTIKNNRIGGAYLHSHWHLYPDGIGAKQQQVTTYSHKDSNNRWIIKRGLADQRPKDIYVRDGDLVVLEHRMTKRNLHSHFEIAPLTKSHFQVTCYGENGLGDANDIWKIQKESTSLSGGDDRIYTVKTRFRLSHYLTGCALHSHSKQLPKWAYEQMEVTCNPKLFDKNNLWNIEDNIFPNLPNVSFQEYAPSFLEKFIESHAVMLQGNAGLKPKEGEVTSRPWQWPLNYRGQFFSASKGHKIYLLGNPIIWWANIAAVPLSLLITISLIVKDKVSRAKSKNTQGDSKARIQTSILSTYLEATIWTFLGWTLHYIPFYFMGRVLYFHHYFPAFLFSCMLTAMTCDYIISFIGERYNCSGMYLERRKMELLVVISSIVVYTFIRFVPLTYGTKAESSMVTSQNDSSTAAWHSEQQLLSLKWLDSWEF